VIFLLSPAKSLDYTSDMPKVKTAEPPFLEESAKLNNAMKRMSIKKLGELMHISRDLAELNHERAQTWQPPFSELNARPAVFAFNGDVYQGLGAVTLKKAELDYVQNHARILSGLYGVLKPFDLMQPYRLEMGTRMKVGRKTNLYQFWGEQIANRISEDAGENTIINLASNEYSKAALTKEFKNRHRILSPQFLDAKGGEYKMISFFAKKARGLMLRYAAQSQAKTVEDLKNFNLEGYYFNDRLSEEKENWIFTRD